MPVTDLWNPVGVRRVFERPLTQGALEDSRPWAEVWNCFAVRSPEIGEEPFFRAGYHPAPRMKRHGHLFEQLVSWPNLLRAAWQASRGKRHRENVLRFQFDYERELLRLEQELKDRTYRPGSYHTFQLTVPKPRMISAAPFRDRVVHHALVNVLEPIFERRFILDSYACRHGKGTHAAIDRFQLFCRRHVYVLKCDIQKFFPSMDHEILLARIARAIKDPDVLWLCRLIVDHSNAQEPVPAYFPGDDLLSVCERRRGLPIGNQTSQFFANVYLDPLDHFVKESLRCGAYLRYVDDFLLCDDDALPTNLLSREVELRFRGRYHAGAPRVGITL